MREAFFFFTGTNRNLQDRLCFILDFTTCEVKKMFSSVSKRCFMIESLVAKENLQTTEDPIRPTALTYSNPTDAFMNGYQSPTGRSLYQNPELVFPESVNHPGLTMNPHQLGGGHLQHPAHFFGTQHRDPLNFYPWVLRNRFFGHRFQGKMIDCWCFFSQS